MDKKSIKSDLDAHALSKGNFLIRNIIIIFMQKT